MPSKDDAFMTNPMNFLNERTVKGTIFGNYRPRTDIPSRVEKYMNKVSLYFQFMKHSIFLSYTRIFYFYFLLFLFFYKQLKME